jgi:predicted secreted protein
VTVRERSSFTLELDESPTTGYRWQLHLDAPARLAVIAETFVPADGRIGGSGRRRWTLRAVKAGSCRVRAELRRGWQPAAEPAARFMLQVEIGGG